MAVDTYLHKYTYIHNTYIILYNDIKESRKSNHKLNHIQVTFFTQSSYLLKNLKYGTKNMASHPDMYITDTRIFQSSVTYYRYFILHVHLHKLFQ